jgi:hypothetical protein
MLRARPHAEVSNALNESGIPGIRYLDQGSRAGGQGSANYVLFNPEMIEILRRYGIVGPAIGAPLSAATLMNERQDQY